MRCLNRRQLSAAMRIQHWYRQHLTKRQLEGGQPCVDFFNDSADRIAPQVVMEKSQPVDNPLTPSSSSKMNHSTVDPLTPERSTPVSSTADTYLLSRETRGDSVTYHIIRSPSRHHPASVAAGDVFRTVAAAISAAFLTQRRFHLRGAFTGIPYFEAQNSVISRRRMPRVGTTVQPLTATQHCELFY